mgnify:FL=1
MTLVEVEIDQAGKAPGRGDLYPVREDRDPDVVAGHRVGAVDDGVDDRLHPRLPWDDVNGAEASVRLQGPTTRTPLVDERESGIDDVGIAPSRRRSPPAAIVCLEPTPVSSAWYRSTRTRAWGRDSWGCSPRGQQARCCQPVVNSDEAPGAQHVQVVPSGVDVSAKPVRMRGAGGPPRRPARTCASWLSASRS